MSRNFKTFLMAGAVAVAVASVPGASSAQTIELKMANWLPPLHHMTLTTKSWLKSIEDASGGRLKITLDKSAVAKPPGQYDVAKNGIRDLAFHVAGYTPGRTPLFRMAEVPFATLNAETGSLGHYNWYTKNGFDKKEIKDAVFITSFVHGPGLLHSKKEIKTIEDIRNVKIRVGGGGVLIAKGLGAVPVAMSASKAHESLQRGTTDAAFFPWESVKGFRLEKLVKFHLEIPGGLYTTPFLILMNKKKFDGLPGFAKDALRKAGGAAGAKLIGRFWDLADDAGKAAAIKNGNKIQTLSKAEQARWAKAVRVIKENWISKADKQGLNGKALMDELVSMMKG